MRQILPSYPQVISGLSSIVESEDVNEWSKAIKKVRDMARTVQLKEADYCGNITVRSTVGRNSVEMVLRRC